ncbi:uncharacterized protein BO97DRAFT_410847 [Aspergillus homomorphus CBS 101889]|uniref:Uncharacterized protein n=1 Tax=Aspergillus homomorphus (strain CBS 101889) TaxID=1450537 RepID=A0A395IBF9_ASPHC|nr:hypothetical protein BO97DRAFT_410847 [Aspergillus homomorphus CBS 101889]RAL16463.1 hypothetical protein BO97DRAFT_410847 [Aspergillus homomorphus CBS 101889]
MNTDTSERLKRLQMDDLGTARREYISTKDDMRHANLDINVGLEDIEAIRESNVPGTQAQFMAEKNKTRLAAWANVYKTIGDTDDLENLDQMLKGQTHRFGLSNAMSLKRLTTTRGGMSRGRGGGVAGTRGRQRKPGVSDVDSRSLGQVGVWRTGNHASNAQPRAMGANRMQSCEAPAVPTSVVTAHQVSLDSQKPKSGQKTKVRRPIVVEISTPEDFMAAVHNVVGGANNAIMNTAVARAVTNNDSSGSSQPPPSANKNNPSQASSRATQPAYRADDGPNQRPASITRNVAQALPRKSPTSQVQAPQALSRKPSLSEPDAVREASKRTLPTAKTTSQVVPLKRDVGPDSKRPDLTGKQNSTNKAISASEIVAKLPPARSEPKPDTLAITTPKEASHASTSVLQDKEEMKASPPAAGGVLVDFSAPTPPEGGLGEQDSTATAIMSPSYLLLQGLDFRQSSKRSSGQHDSSCSEASSTSTKFPNTERALFSKGTSTAENSIDTDKLAGDDEIEKLCDHLKSISLSDEGRQWLTEHLDHLVRGITGRKEFDSKHQPYREGAEHHKAHNQMPLEASLVLTNIPSNAATGAKSPLTPLAHESQIKSPVSQTRLKVDAPIFYPKKSQTSAVSTASQANTEQIRRGPPPSTSLANTGQAHSTPPPVRISGAHLFGDHLLPGRSGNPFTPLAQNDLPPSRGGTRRPLNASALSAQPVSVFQDLQVPSFTGRFGPSTPTSTPGKRKSTTPSLSQTDANSASPALQKSMHAPKTSENKSPAALAPPKGLESSKYAMPASDKPLR